MSDREGVVVSLPVEGRPTELKVIHIHERPEAVAVLPPPAASRPWNPPVVGVLAALFGTAALFGQATLALAPLALLFSLVALCLRQFSWAAIGAGTAIVALLTSIWFWTLLGAGWIATWLAGYLI
ncbi:MAG TPA: hypothetical protein VED46_04670 [Alphaproteobacteria bacterium]|nr:hypothetical protein [Alphaproteobacteria bacterium]